MKRKPLESSCFRSVGYNPKSKTLELEFQAGGVYRYSNVPEKIHRGLMEASSPGRFFHQNIRSVYPPELMERGAGRRVQVKKARGVCRRRYSPFLKEDIEFGQKLAAVVAGASIPLGLVLLFAWIARLESVMGVAGVLLILIWGTFFSWAAFGGHSRGR
jgi:hypothetical protein